jgi:hypothetical protein
MSEEWLQVCKRSRFYLVFVTLYGGITESFFGLIGVVGVVTFLGNLLQLTGIHVFSGELDLHLGRELRRGSMLQIAFNCFAFLMALALSAALAWWGLRAAWACLLDVVCPTVTYEGRLDEISTWVEGGLHADVRNWKLTAGGKAWAVPILSTDKRLFEKQVIAGKEIRLRYLRGSEEITRMWVKQTGAEPAEPPVPSVAPAHRKKKAARQP